IRDPEITEIMVNGPHKVYVERDGKLHRTDAFFRSEEELRHAIDKIVARVGRRVDESSPYVDARLADGSRVNAIIPPLAIHGSALTIRKFSADPLTVEDLDQFGTLTRALADLLQGCVRGRMNLLVSGGTGAGKTTMLNVLSGFLPEDERIITIEDSAELRLQQPHVIALEYRPPNIEGEGEVTIRDLVRNALRMRPDRIIVGEVRGGETLDMLQAMNTGHDGSPTTIHANSPRDALSRLETLVLTAGVDLPLRAIREQIASAFDLLVQISRLVDGSRRVTHVTEVLRMESDVITLQDVFIAKPPDEETAAATRSSRLLTPLTCTGLKPHFLEKLAANGVALPPSFFEHDEAGLRTSFGANYAGPRLRRRQAGGRPGRRRHVRLEARPADHLHLRDRRCRERAARRRRRQPLRHRPLRRRRPVGAVARKRGVPRPRPRAAHRRTRRLEQGEPQKGDRRGPARRRRNLPDRDRRQGLLPGAAPAARPRDGRHLLPCRVDGAAPQDLRVNRDRAQQDVAALVPHDGE